MGAVADKLDAARALIEKGWTQEDYSNSCKPLSSLFNEQPDGICFCATGAIAWAIKEFPDNREAQEPFRLLAEAAGVSPHTWAIEQWNDAEERTQADVIDAFKRAAELARERGL